MCDNVQQALKKVKHYVENARNIKTPYDDGTLYGNTTEYIPVKTVLEILDFVNQQKVK